VALVALAQSSYGIKMWAMLRKNNESVLAVFPPTTPYEILEEEREGKTLVLMHEKNSPAWLNGTYIKGKFYEPTGYYTPVEGE
jgi:hypothetical protein